MSGDGWTFGRGFYQSLGDRPRFERGDDDSPPAGEEDINMDIEEQQQPEEHQPAPAPRPAHRVRRGRSVRPRTTGIRLEITREPDGIHIPTEATAQFLETIRTKLDPQGRAWGDLPSDITDHYWQEFQNDCFWDPSITRDVHRAWVDVIRVRYNQYMNRLRTRPRPKDIEEIAPEIFDSMKAAWTDPTYVKKRDQAAKNRRGKSGKASATHVGGSISMVDWAHKIAEELGRPADYIEVFDRLHMKKDKDGNLVYDEESEEMTPGMIKDRCKEVFKEFHRLTQQETQQGTQMTPEMRNQLYMQAVGSFDERMRVFGIGSIAETIPRPKNPSSKKKSSKEPDDIDDLSRSHYSFKSGMERYVRRYKDDDDDDDYGFGGGSGSGSGTNVH